MKLLNRFAITMLMLLCPALLVAAAPSGSLKGTVVDPNGAPVLNAQLAISSPAAGETQTTTNEDGQFSFSGLVAGEYALTARADGFQEAVIPVKVGTATAPLQRIRLKVAVATEELTVTADAADPTSADGNASGIQVDHDLLKSLPVKEGNPLAAASLFVDPAATGVEGTKILVDGVETSELDIPSSSVQKVFVNKNSYSAEFGRPGKGRIEVMTRPGSLRRIHHRFILTLRNSALDARNAFAVTRPPMQRELYEAEMDGPLPRHLGTFYVGGEYLRDNQNAFVSALIPNGTASVSTPERNGRIMGRVDLQLNPLNTLSLRYSLNRDAKKNQGVGGFDLLERAYNSNDHAHEFRVSEIANLSASFSNEVRFAYKNKASDDFGLSNAPAVLVIGFFNGGGAQIAKRQRETVLEFQDFASIIRGKHSWRLGAGVKRRAFDISDASNFGGTFTFSGLDAFTQNQPFLFTANTGNPKISFPQTEYFYFAQDEIKLRPDLGLMVGLRHELQTNLGDHNNLAPRMALSWAPGNGTTSFRLGGGIFYQRQPWTMKEHALLLDGFHLRQIVVSNPSFPIIPDLTLVPPSVDRIAPNIRTPYSAQASLAVEHRFGNKTFLSVEYSMLRGIKLYRMLNLNAPLPGAEVPPNPDFINLDQFESSGRSRNNSVSVTFRTALRKRFELLSQYTFSRSYDNTSGLFYLPANNFNPNADYGRSDFDRRHRLNLAGIFNLPLGLKLGTIASLSSGLPFNITTGFDGNHDTLANDRPSGVGRNTGQGPAFANLDVRMSRRFMLRSGDRSPYIELRFDAFNVLNTVNPTNYVGTLNSALFGRANSASPARQMQLSVKFSF